MARMAEARLVQDVLYEAGFRHPGHTEYLAALAAAPGAAPPTAVMLLWSGRRRGRAGRGGERREVFGMARMAEARLVQDVLGVPVTIHVALRRVPDLLTADLVVETARIVDRDLRCGRSRPRGRRSVGPAPGAARRGSSPAPPPGPPTTAGLNPHAGEAGTMGTEDRDVLAPAVERLRAEGIAVPMVPASPACGLSPASTRRGAAKPKRLRRSRSTMRVPDLLTADLVVETARIVDRDLRSRFGLAAPRLVRGTACRPGAAR
jgi:4-hydroxy-L-threonine phosphate dehydrogenase PdxA